MRNFNQHRGQICSTPSMRPTSSGLKYTSATSVENLSPTSTAGLVRRITGYGGFMRPLLVSGRRLGKRSRMINIRDSFYKGHGGFRCCNLARKNGSEGAGAPINRTRRVVVLLHYGSIQC